MSFSVPVLLSHANPSQTSKVFSMWLSYVHSTVAYSLSWLAFVANEARSATRGKHLFLCNGIFKSMLKYHDTCVFGEAFFSFFQESFKLEFLWKGLLEMQISRFYPLNLSGDMTHLFIKLHVTIADWLINEPISQREPLRGLRISKGWLFN